MGAVNLSKPLTLPCGVTLKNRIAKAAMTEGLAGGDNHADHPAPLGGGGARVACGVVK